MRQVKAAFGRNGWLDVEETPVAPRHGGRKRVRPGQIEATRPFEQVNLVLGMEGLRRDDDRRFALGVLNTALGGGTSSRLFQEVREHRGLAYSVFSFSSHHADSGLVGVSVGCLPNRLDDVLAVVRDGAGEGRCATASPPRSWPGARASCAVVWCSGSRTPASRMSRIGKAELVHDELLGIDEVMRRIDAVTVERGARRGPRGLRPPGDPRGRRSRLTREVSAGGVPRRRRRRRPTARW